MPVFRLTRSLVFPPVCFAEPDGLLAVGGDLSLERLLLAYREGIFPWYSKGYPVLWWSPDPRLVLFPDQLKISKSLGRVLRKGCFRVTFDRSFVDVMEKCAQVPRKFGEGTWIVPEMVQAYQRLHLVGYAHSVETLYEGKLVGGLYGVSMGRVFFGESMFTEMTDASKVALVYLVALLRRMGFVMIDCQVTTSHLQRLGALEISRHEFMARLREGIKGNVPVGLWSSEDIGPADVFSR